MNLRRVPAPTGDPFWDTLLRRHPDLELVLLPPEQPEPPAAESRPLLDEVTLEAVRRALRVAVDAVLARVGVDVESVVAQQTERLAAGATRGTVSVHVRRVVPGGADEASPREVVEALREDRWDVSDHPGVVHRVVASRADLPAGRGGLRVGVTVVVGLARTTGSLQIEAETVDLPVGEAAARALLDAQRREREKPATDDDTDARDASQGDD
ncbi:hypothetical protein G7072_00555 [Nocardioides sp. HDW12B]|uniref:hypothetical protein n=1 Tax=Nocardioides sp. HDW12B TaxID=2714939 RepID=UPI00140D8F79|nr:hypothetical protein [Nocardioides sp. HDW12B]QIK65024.1 hypothetical protein G7072_00555 [Nocardioides sp. HDW12B]